MATILIAVVTIAVMRQLCVLSETTNRVQLDEATFTATFKRGRELNDAETIAIALDDARA